jgi:peptidoglycan/LPS O-acetylase OafA/YrhL
VAVVVVYHVWPTALPGGFIGVDVFFVISGFLITQHLLEEIQRSGRVSVARFWARRIRRLLPAAFVVLAASLVVLFMAIPATRWQQGLIEVAASAAYVQNWVLAAASVDYLAAENDPSVVQHFWSLSVEEQFYVVWPLLIVLLLTVSAVLRRRGWTTSSTVVIGFGLTAVAIASFGYSLWLTAIDPGVAYFSTATRAWEFAAGGLLAVAGRRARLMGEGFFSFAVSWVGFGAIMLSAVVISESTPFPGIAALLPVGGAALVLVAGRSRVIGAPSSLLGVRPVQYLGDISYSVYLWHWPLVVAYPFLRGNDPGLLGGAAIVVITLVLAGVTKRFVEDPYRRGDSIIGTPRAAFVFALGGVLVFGGVAAIGSAKIAADQESARVDAALFAECQGALSLDEGAPADCLRRLEGAAVYPTLASREGDTAVQYACYVGEGQEFRTCSYGPDDAVVRLAITGDSHAASVIPGLRAAAEENGWRLDVFVGRGCSFQPSGMCGARAEFDAALIAGEYDAVLVTSWRSTHPPVENLVTYWSPFLAQGVPIVAVGDVPHLPEDVNACIDASGGDGALLRACIIPLDAALDLQPDRYLETAATLGIPSIDLSPLFCLPEGCPTVIGGVLVYRDSPFSHITSTFSGTMGRFWTNQLTSVLAAEQR